MVMNTNKFLFYDFVIVQVYLAITIHKPLKVLNYVGATNQQKCIHIVSMQRENQKL